MALGLGLGLAGGVAGLVSNFLNRREGGRYSYNPLDLSNISLELQRLGALPPSPYRDAAIASLSSSIQPLQQQSKQAYANIMPSIENYGRTADDLVGRLGGITNEYMSLGSDGANPYLVYYNDPGGTEGRLTDIKNRDVNAAFSEYGTQGGEALQRMGQVMSQNARRGILNSGYNRRQMEAERMRLMQAKNEALAKGEQFVQGTMQNVFTNYNDGLRNRAAFLSGAANAAGQAGQIAGAIPEFNLKAGQMLGNDYRNTLGLQSSMETQKRNEQIQRDQQNNALANQEKMAKFNMQGNQAVSNWQGQNNLQQSTPNFLESALQGATSLMPYGSYLGSLGGGSNSSSGGGNFFGDLFGGGSNGNNNRSSMVYNQGGNSYGGGTGYYGY